jgi:hypothetical protein
MTNSERIEPPHVGAEDLLLAPEEAARLIGMSVSWLAKARARGDGPRYVRYGRSVRYPRSYLLEDIRTRSSTSDRSGHAAEPLADAPEPSNRPR